MKEVVHLDKITQLLWERSESALTELARLCGSGLRRMAMNILGSAEDAEESVNDTYLAVWNAVPPKEPDPLPPFAYRVGRNIALNRLRHRTAQKRSSYEVSLDELSACIAGPDLWETLDARALGRAIDRFLDTLNQSNRVMFLRRYWFGDSVRDIARHFDLTENAVSVRLNRTRSKLKTYLTEEGFYE